MHEEVIHNLAVPLPNWVKFLLNWADSTRPATYASLNMCKSQLAGSYISFSSPRPEIATSLFSVNIIGATYNTRIIQVDLYMYKT